MQLNFREIWYNYKSEVRFGIVLTTLMVLSYWLGAYIPEEIFERVINPLEYSATAFVCLFGGWVMLRHHEGMTIRKSWAVVLLLWGSIELLMLVLRFDLHISAIGSTPDNPLYNTTVTVGNILAWLLFIYPAILFLAICWHIRKYRLWCEENYSSMERIDVQWIVRYLIILALLGLSFYFICFWYVPNRMFTQQWMILLMFAYSTEQIHFRKDPWAEVKSEGVNELKNEGKELNSPKDDQREAINSANGVPASNAQWGAGSAQRLTHWMCETKPYLNPEFPLMDLRAVLPMNRTYLSRFIRDEFGCTFYQLVNKYRIEEAKRLMQEQPELKMTDIATLCGFSSPSVFAQTFSKVTGMSPREWRKDTKKY